MIFECSQYRAYLKAVLVERIRRNPNYSLRSFSKGIGVSPSMLSEVMRGEKRLSFDKATVIASRLELSLEEEQFFLSMVQLENTQDTKQQEKILARMRALSPNKELRDLSIDHFHAVADWVCVAGLALLDGHPKGLTALDIGSRLGITQFEAAQAMERWVHLDFLEVSNGVYRRTSGEHLVMRSPAPNGALRRLHQSMLEKAIESLETQSNQEKFVGSETIAIDPARLDEVSEIIEEAVKKVLKIAKPSRTKTEVYHLGFQFFRVTKKGKKI